MNSQKEHSKFIIQRFDNYINAVNARSAFLLAFNSFLAGGVISNYNTIVDIMTPNKIPSPHLFVVKIELVILFVTSLVTTAFIMKAVYPFLSSGNTSIGKYHSLIFFKSVAEFTSDKEYLDTLSASTETEVEEDLARQSYQLAKGLKEKYAKLSWAIRFVYIQLILLVTILFTIIF